MTDWLSISAYAKAYSVARHTVYKWRDAGLLETFQVGAVIRIRNAPPRVHGCVSRQDAAIVSPSCASIMDAQTCDKP